MKKLSAILLLPCLLCSLFFTSCGSGTPAADPGASDPGTVSASSDITTKVTINTLPDSCKSVTLGTNRYVPIGLKLNFWEGTDTSPKQNDVYECTNANQDKLRKQIMDDL